MVAGVAIVGLASGGMDCAAGAGATSPNVKGLGVAEHGRGLGRGVERWVLAGDGATIASIHHVVAFGTAAVASHAWGNLTGLVRAHGRAPLDVLGAALAASSADRGRAAGLRLAPAF